MMENSRKNEEPVHCSLSEKQIYMKQIVWKNVFKLTILHIGMLYGIYLAFTAAKLRTTLFGFVLVRLGLLGITAGSHRLWSHRSYEAKWPLRVFLCLLQTLAYQDNIYIWCRNNRGHHKFAETDADPHNMKRGLFFGHVGWLMCKKHPDVIKKGKSINLDDVLNDPIVKFQRRFYVPLVAVISFYLPTMIPVWCWGETAWESFFVATITRYCLCLNFILFINSIAHKYGEHPFDKDIGASDNAIMSILTAGEGYHNYHHVFPWDYAGSEMNCTGNTTKVFIDVMAKIGLAYNLKVAKPSIVMNRKKKNEDCSREQTSMTKRITF